jgi:hypothetical protein
MVLCENFKSMEKQEIDGFFFLRLGDFSPIGDDIAKEMIEEEMHEYSENQFCIVRKPHRKSVEGVINKIGFAQQGTVGGKRGGGFYKAYLLSDGKYYYEHEIKDYH